MNDYLGSNVIVNNEYYHDVSGVVCGITVDLYYLVELSSGNKIFVESGEFEVIS